MRFRLRVTRLTRLGERTLLPGDILDLDTADQTAVLAVSLDWNVGAVLGLMAAGDADPIDLSPDAARQALWAAAPPPPPRVLAFRRRPRAN
jgi:hypothetical protein